LFRTFAAVGHGKKSGKRESGKAETFEIQLALLGQLAGEWTTPRAGGRSAGSAGARKGKPNCAGCGECAVCASKQF